MDANHEPGDDGECVATCYACAAASEPPDPSPPRLLLLTALAVDIREAFDCRREGDDMDEEERQAHTYFDGNPDGSQGCLRCMAALALGLDPCE